MQKAVTTAEKRPVCGREEGIKCNVNESLVGKYAHKDEKVAKFISNVLDHLIVEFLDVLPAEVPPVTGCDAILKNVLLFLDKVCRAVLQVLH